MAGYSLFDVLQPSQPAMFDIYDMPGAGPSPSPTPQTQAAMGPQQSGWTQFLTRLARQGANNQGGDQAAPRAASPVGAAMPLQASPAPSQKGFGGNSRKGFDMQSLITLASLYAGGVGALGGMGAGASAGAGGGGATGGMGSLGSILGGLGGGGQQPSGPRMSYAPLPQQAGPLVPQSAAYWQANDDPWLFRG